jgi:hypothetical protein
MPALELFDETLDINSTENYELSVQICSDSLSFCILDILRNKFVMLRSYESDENSSFSTAKLADTISKDDFLIRRFRKVNIITPSQRSTLVPSPLYDVARKDEYFHFNHETQPGNVILVNELREPEAFLIFEIPEDLNEVLKTFFPGKQPSHQLKPLLNYMTISRRSTGGSCVNVHLEKDFIDMAVLDQNSLRFCNAFAYNTASDIRYYVLYVLKRLGISQDESVTLSGRPGKNDGLISGLSDYLGNVRYAHPSGNFTLSYVFNDAVLHKFLNLFMITNCE